jgi:hypothetical protein
MEVVNEGLCKIPSLLNQTRDQHVDATMHSHLNEYTKLFKLFSIKLGSLGTTYRVH